MKTVLVLLAFLTNGVTTFGQTLTVNGYTFSSAQMAKLKILSGQTATSGRATTLRLPNGTAGYQNGGTNLIVWATKVYTTSAQGNTCQLGYGDTDVGINSASAPTNPVYLNADSTNIVGMTYNTPVNGVVTNFNIVANKYGVQYAVGNAVSCTFYAILD